MTENHLNSQVPLNLIIGAGRSGTTWLGSIVNSHPEVAYRFEPFHRLQQELSTVENFNQILANPHISDDDLAQIYEALIKADPLTEKPPFFKKDHISTAGIKLTWLFARLVRPAKAIYTGLYTPKKQPPLVIKEVSFEKFMENLLTNTSVPVTYLVRHPCGNILSQVRGQQRGKMPTQRHQYLGRLMKNHDPALYDQYGNQLDQMTPLEKTAWLWRMGLEMGIKAIRSTNKGLLLFYEQLCDEPYHSSKQVFQNFGLTFPKETEEFIDQLQNTDDDKNAARKKDLMNGFFTVYRNTKKQKNSWKKKITAEERQTIEKIVKDSPAFEYCAALGHWD